MAVHAVAMLALVKKVDNTCKLPFSPDTDQRLRDGGQREDEEED